MIKSVTVAFCGASRALCPHRDGFSSHHGCAAASALRVMPPESILWHCCCEAGIKMKPVAHDPAPHWFCHAPGHPLRQSRDARVAVSEAGSSPLMDNHPLAGIGLTLAGSFLAGTAWMAFILWWAPR